MYRRWRSDRQSKRGNHRQDAQMQLTELCYKRRKNGNDRRKTTGRLLSGSAATPRFLVAIRFTRNRFSIRQSSYVRLRLLLFSKKFFDTFWKPYGFVFRFISGFILRGVCLSGEAQPRHLYQDKHTLRLQIHFLS